MLTVAIGIAQQTSKSTKSAEEFKDSFIQRLRAMARSYELLSRENWTDAAVDELLQIELEPFGPDRFVAEGPTTRLKPAQAMSIGMVLHELATNAGKYGALSVPMGRVHVTWSVKTNGEGERLELVWKEKGGRETMAPQKRGFGLKLIDREVEFNLAGKSSVAFERDGLKMTLEIPLN